MLKGYNIYCDFFNKQGDLKMAEKKKGTFWKDFKAFITRGNVIDMAVGVVIGGAFGKIVTGLVNYIINPVCGLFIKSGALDDVKTVLKEAVLNAEGEIETAEVAILWGTWLQTIMDFIITAFCIFVVLRIIMRAKNTLEHKKMLEAEAAAEAAKADADRKAAEAAAVAAAAAEKQAQLDASIIEQAKLLAEIRDLMKNKLNP